MYDFGFLKSDTMEDIRAIMRKLSMALNNIDEIYYTDVAKMGLGKSLLWLLYALDNGEAHSQREICAQWGFPKSTLNSTIKQAEAKGYLTLTPIPGKRREMSIHLTAAGEAYAHAVLAPIYEAENKALAETVAIYSPDFIEALVYFNGRLKAAFAEQIAAAQKVLDKS